MNSLKDQLHEISDESYQRWFDRWFEKENLENAFIKSASKGYGGYQIKITDLYDDYLERRLNNVKIIGLLQDKFPSLEIEITKVNKSYYFLGNLQKRTKKYISFSWRNLND